MLAANEPEALEYWLHSGEIAALMGNYDAGLIDHETFTRRCQEWVDAHKERLAQIWRERLDALKPAGTFSVALPGGPLLTGSFWEKPAGKTRVIDEATVIPKHLLPEPRKPRTRDRSR